MRLRILKLASMLLAVASGCEGKHEPPNSEEPLKSNVSSSFRADVTDDYAAPYVEIDLEYPDRDGDGFDAEEDCNDEDPSIHPGLEALCADGVDNDCDGKIDLADPDCSKND